MNLQQITIQTFSTSSKNDTYLLETEGRFFEIGHDAAELLTYLRAHGDSDESIRQYVNEHGGRPTKEEITAFMDVMDKKTTGNKNDSVNNKRKSFLYSKDFIPATVAERYSTMLSHLFNPWVMTATVSMFVALDVAYFLFFKDTRNHTSIDIYILAGMYIFLIASSLIHEFGHASACRRYGTPHGNIGLGLYLNMPVFYTDVSHIWKLLRRQRCVVNFGGVYFQMLLLIPFLAAAIATGNNLLKYMIVLMNLNFLITMNPFFKFDGYWMMTDMLGVANLRQKGKEWIAYTWYKLRGKEMPTRPYLLSLPRWTGYALIAYTVVVGLFFGFYFFYVIPKFFIRFYETFPTRFRNMLTDLSSHRMPEWSNMQQICLQLLFLVFFAYMAYRLTLPLFRRFNIWKKQ